MNAEHVFLEELVEENFFIKSTTFHTDEIYSRILHKYNVVQF